VVVKNVNATVDIAEEGEKKEKEEEEEEEEKNIIFNATIKAKTAEEKEAKEKEAKKGKITGTLQIIKHEGEENVNAIEDIHEDVKNVNARVDISQG